LAYPRADLRNRLELGIPTHQTEPDLPQADDVRINDTAPVMRAAGNVIELAPMNFSFPPSGPRCGSLHVETVREGTD
jgi:hypothetical protein